MAETPSAGPAPKPPRILACERCHRRKIKCNRTFPCYNCVETGSSCVQLTPQKTKVHRRVREKDVLRQLQRYEELLKRDGVASERSNDEDLTPLNTVEDDKERSESALEDGQDAQSSEKLTIWQTADPLNERLSAVAVGAEENDSSRSAGQFTDDKTMQTAMDRLHRHKNDHLLFFAPDHRFDLAGQQPSQAQLFKLWQIYQDNIDPMLKVTHVPTIQARIVDAVGSPDEIEMPFMALLFSIYSVALVSLTEAECSQSFGMTISWAGLIDKYQVACQQALLRSGYLCSDDRDCLTAAYLYMVSIKPSVDRRSLCSMLGSIFRVAQRMEIHNESKNAKHGVFEAEMRRRLWWSLVIFDTHVCEMSNNPQSANLISTWDCKTPSNINDSDLRPGMKSLYPRSNVPTQALYVAARSAVCQYLRHSQFQLAFINPSLASFSKRKGTDDRLISMDEIELVDKLHGASVSEHLDMDNSLHCITLWVVRAQLSKARLLHHYWRRSRRSPEEQTDTNPDSATLHALRILECEAQLTNLSHVRGFLWHISRFYFPAYIHILKDLQARPMQACAGQAWDIMSANFHARVKDDPSRDNPVIRLFANLVLQAWAAREHVDASFLIVPQIVSDARSFVAPTDDGVVGDPLFDPAMGFNLDDFLPVPMEFSDQYCDEGSSALMNE